MKEIYLLYDSIIYRPIKTPADCIQLQEDLESAVKWEQDWLMACVLFARKDVI
jgi:hypothetical protein